jgi:nicotinamide mononucleotide transporter
MNGLIEYYTSTTGIIEIIATILLIVNVYLISKQKLINYWFGLAGVILMGYVLFQAALYSDMLLQWVFYAPLQIVGWYMWKYGKTLGDIATDTLDSMKVVTISWKARIYIVLAILLGALPMGYVMAYFGGAVPYIDALTTTMSIAASFLLLKKIWENWIIWITMDLIAIPLYYSRDLYVFSGLYVVFLGLATYGAITWYRDMKAQNA